MTKETKAHARITFVSSLLGALLPLLGYAYLQGGQNERLKHLEVQGVDHEQRIRILEGNPKPTSDKKPVPMRFEYLAVLPGKDEIYEAITGPVPTEPFD